MLHHTIDMRVASTLRFSDNEVSQIVTGLLSGQSYDSQQRTSISEVSVLDGAYVIEFSDKPAMHGTVTVNVIQQPYSLAPIGCCEDKSGCCHKDTHTTSVEVILGEASFSPPHTTHSQQELALGFR